jgi:hypothetical protein
MLAFTLLALRLALLAPTGTDALGLRPASLRVERLAEHEALGIDSAHPMLSWAWVRQRRQLGTASAWPPAGTSLTRSVCWRLASQGVPDDTHRGAPAPGAHVRVALTAAALGSDDGSDTMWEATLPSGSEGSLRYAGPALPSISRVHWRVCTPTGSCASASFVTGHLTPSGWSASWIAGRQLRSPELHLPHGRAIRSAVLTISGLGFYEAFLNGAVRNAPSFLSHPS